jgi:hypothetical protein
LGILIFILHLTIVLAILEVKLVNFEEAKPEQFGLKNIPHLIGVHSTPNGDARNWAVQGRNISITNKFNPAREVVATIARAPCKSSIRVSRLGNQGNNWPLLINNNTYVQTQRQNKNAEAQFANCIFALFCCGNSQRCRFFVRSAINDKRYWTFCIFGRRSF